MIAFQRHIGSFRRSIGCVKADYIERTDHCAHAAADALARLDQHDLLLVSRPMDGAGWAGALAWRRIAVAAFVRERGIEIQPWFGVDAGFWRRSLENSQEWIFCLRVSKRTGEFTLLTANAALRMDEHRFHNSHASFQAH
jgi:hypothetical protein